MKTPDVSCEINAICSLKQSEDPKKVERAITNILVNVDVKIKKDSLRATSSSFDSLQKIYDAIHSHQTQNTYRLQLNHNLTDESTWFYLNKQAAYANTIALCSESEESPLGPIKIILNSKNIEQVIDWLIEPN